MKAVPFLAFEVRRCHGDGPGYLVRPVTVERLDMKTRQAFVTLDMGRGRTATTYADFNDLRTDRNAAGELLAEKLIASPDDQTSAVAEMAGASGGA